MADLQGRVEALERTLEELCREKRELERARRASERRARRWSAACGLLVLGLLVLAQPGTRTVVAQTAQATLEQRVATLESKSKTKANRIAVLENKLAHFSRSGNDVFITGANLHLRSGQGATNGNSRYPQSTDPAVTRTNGLGNFIVGYNEAPGRHPRTGSHNLVLGTNNGYPSYGGLLAGAHNSASARTRSSVVGSIVPPAAVTPR